MSAVDFAKCLSRVLVYEGGKVDDPHDPGGRTNQGVTQATFNAWLRQRSEPVRDVYTMTANERDAIYRAGYWILIQGDALPPGVDLVVFDAAVNSGVSRAGKWLQSALGDHYTGDHDGAIGNKTLQAIADFGDNSELIEEICARRLATLRHLSSWSRYGKGWSARIANCQKIAISWVAESPEMLPVDVSGLGGHNKAIVTGNVKPPMISAISAHVTTAAAGTGAIATQATQQMQAISGLADTLSWAKYVFMGLGVLGVAAGVAASVAKSAKEAAEAGTAKTTVDTEADAGLPSMLPIEVSDATRASMATVAPAPAATN